MGPIQQPSERPHVPTTNRICYVHITLPRADPGRTHCLAQQPTLGLHKVEQEPEDWVEAAGQAARSAIASAASNCDIDPLDPIAAVALSGGSPRIT